MKAAEGRQTGQPIKAERPIKLDFRSQSSVIVVPDDEDRFIVTAREAAHACKQVDTARKWQSQFDEFLRHIHEWCKQHANVVAAAFMGIDGGLKVFVVTKGPEYRFEFDDEITELDKDLASKFAMCPNDVLQVPESPPESLATFFAVGSSLQIFGK